MDRTGKRAAVTTVPETRSPGGLVALSPDESVVFADRQESTG